MPEIDIKRPLRDMQPVRDLPRAQLALAVQGLRRLRGRFRLPRYTLWPASDPPVSPCGAKPRLNTLADQITLDLGQRGENGDGEPPMRRRGIDGIVQTLQPDASIHQYADQIQETPERSAQTVQLPDDQHIANPDITEQFVEYRPLGTRPDYRLAVDFLAPGFAQGINLNVETRPPDADVCVTYPQGDTRSWFIVPYTRPKALSRTLFQVTSFLNRKCGRLCTDVGSSHLV